MSDREVLVAARAAVNAVERYLLPTDHRSPEREQELRQAVIHRNDELRDLLIARGF